MNDIISKSEILAGTSFAFRFVQCLLRECKEMRKKRRMDVAWKFYKYLQFSGSDNLPRIENCAQYPNITFPSLIIRFGFLCVRLQRGDSDSSFFSRLTIRHCAPDFDTAAGDVIGEPENAGVSPERIHLSRFVGVYIRVYIYRRITGKPGRAVSKRNKAETGWEGRNLGRIPCRSYTLGEV